MSSFDETKASHVAKRKSLSMKSTLRRTLCGLRVRVGARIDRKSPVPMLRISEV